MNVGDFISSLAMGRLFGQRPPVGIQYSTFRGVGPESKGAECCNPIKTMD